jgi:hypothetical protein
MPGLLWVMLMFGTLISAAQLSLADLAVPGVVRAAAAPAAASGSIASAVRVVSAAMAGSLR